MSVLNIFSSGLKKKCFSKNQISKSAFINSNICRYNSSDAAEAEETNGDDEKPERRFFKKPELIDGFEVFDVYMNKKNSDQLRRKFVKYNKSEKDTMARANRMSVDQDWTNAWPTASTFKQNAVPLPVRQGVIRSNCENDGLPPTKYANAELMKIPNFLHLTKPHVKKHCAAIKQFCTPWPKELSTHEAIKKNFPISTTTSNYIYDGPSIRDDRARIVTLTIKVSDLNLDKRSKEKFIRLAEHRYNKQTDQLKIIADRCPYRRQNEDYANYLLTTLYYESKNFEDWENDICEEDRPDFVWEQSQSRENMRQFLAESQNATGVENYSNDLEKVFNESESPENIDGYKKSVLRILNLKTATNE